MRGHSANELMTFLFAGYDTTSTLCAFAAWQSIRTYKSLYSRTSCEVRINRWSDYTRYDWEDDILGCFLARSCQCQVASSCCYYITRFVEKYEPALGESLPAGTRIQIPIKLYTTPSPKYWADPEEFKPERWLERDEKFYRFAFLPFLRVTVIALGSDLPRIRPN